MKFEKQLNYSDVSLIPTKCIVDSRSQCSTQVKLGERTFEMPIIPANMKSVVDEDTCIFLAKKNWFYIMHRFGKSNYEFCKIMKEQNLYSSISVGVNKESYDDLNDIYKDGFSPDYITIDVANAWSDKAVKMAKNIRLLFPKTFIIIGNIATREAINDLIKELNNIVGAFKICLAEGASCITKNKTGVFRGAISTIMDCYDDKLSYPIIADGGIVHHGDIAKAISAGATAVVAGSLFAGYDQSSGNIIELDDNKKYKEYYGSASKYNKSEYKNIEGKKILISYRGDMNNLLKELKEDLQSSISYLGGKCLNDIRGQQKFYLV